MNQVTVICSMKQVNYIQHETSDCCIQYETSKVTYIQHETSKVTVVQSTKIISNWC